MKRFRKERKHDFEELKPPKKYPTQCPHCGLAFDVGAEYKWGGKTEIRKFLVIPEHLTPRPEPVTCPGTNAMMHYRAALDD